MTLRRDFLAFTLGAVAARTVLPPGAKAAPAVASTEELLHRYDEWLDAERLAVMQELYPWLDPFEARRFVPCTGMVGHWWTGPAPSTRVLAVLAAASVPTEPDTVEARRALWEARKA